MHETTTRQTRPPNSFAENVHLLERLVVAPRGGTFHPANLDVSTAEPERVALGDKIGVVIHMGEKHAVESPFTGKLRGILVLPGERVRPEQPVAWLTVDD